MFNALFGRKKATVKTSAPWDEINYGSINVPIWRSRTKDGRARYVFGISRPFEKRGEKFFAKTFEIENVRDILHGIEKLAMALAAREDLSLKDRTYLDRILSILDRALSDPEGHGKVVNGHGEPQR